MNSFITAFLISVFFFVLGEKGYAYSDKEHHIRVIHPGISLTDSIDCLLVEIPNDEGLTDGYYMDVKSVVCGDKQCRVDIVRIYWDHLGRFNRLSLPDRVDLEKAEGKSFTEEDYAKLNRILTNPKSSLKEVFKEEIVGTIGGEGIDAVSRATVSLDQNTYVVGAAWTCYTLWHWVHGEVKTKIRDITGEALSIADLHIYLEQENLDSQIFAIEQLKRRKGYTKASARKVFEALENNSTLLKTSLEYMNQAPVEVLKSGIERLIQSSNRPYRIGALNTLLKTQTDLPQIFYDTLGKHISEFETYEENHLFFRLLTVKRAVSPVLIEQIIPLLRNPNFLIARMAYWFLVEQQLTQSQQKQLKTFYRKNKKRL